MRRVRTRIWMRCWRKFSCWFESGGGSDFAPFLMPTIWGMVMEECDMERDIRYMTYQEQVELAWFEHENGLDGFSPPKQKTLDEIWTKHESEL